MLGEKETGEGGKEEEGTEGGQKDLRVPASYYVLNKHFWNERKKFDTPDKFPLSLGYL